MDQDKMDDQAHKQVQAVAALAGMVKANAAELDENIISTSGNLQPINSKWSPEDVVRREVQSMAASQGGIVPPSASVPPPPPPAPIPQVDAVMQAPVYAEPVAPPTQPMNLDLFTEINNRLKAIETDVSTIKGTYEQILNNMLNSKAKTITIKFDEAQNTKQDRVRKSVSKSDKQD